MEHILQSLSFHLPHTKVRPSIAAKTVSPLSVPDSPALCSFRICRTWGGKGKALYCDQRSFCRIISDPRNFFHPTRSASSRIRSTQAFSDPQHKWWQFPQIVFLAQFRATSHFVFAFFFPALRILHRCMERSRWLADGISDAVTVSFLCICVLISRVFSQAQRQKVRKILPLHRRRNRYAARYRQSVSNLSFFIYEGGFFVSLNPWKY